MLVKAVKLFDPDLVVVLGRERLFNDIQKDLPKFKAIVFFLFKLTSIFSKLIVIGKIDDFFFVQIFHLPKAGGAEDRSPALRSTIRHKTIRLV
jgi:predicted NBD/HSP70 family sugar kinase